jgi:hypothetical protein
MRLNKTILTFFAGIFMSSTLLSGPKPIAKWDVVPNQRFTGVFNVGLVAFHESRLKVEFFVDGTKVHETSEAKLNERTGVVEYHFPLDSALYGDKQLSISAKIESSAGDICEMPAVLLYSNHNKSMGSNKVIYVDSENGIDYSDGSKDAPMRTLAKAVAKCGDGGVVICRKGLYSAKRIGGGFNRKFWTTIMPDKNLSRGDVKIEGGRPATNFIKFKNVDLFVNAEGTYEMILGGDGDKNSTYAWVDNCRMYNMKGRHSADASPFGNKLMAYVTGGMSAMLKNGPCHAKLVRGHKVKQISGEAFSGNDMLVVNSSVSDVNPEGDETAKPSLFAGCAITPKWLEDIVFYNVSAHGINGNVIVAARIRNSAFVNVDVDTVNEGAFSRFTDKMENVYLKNFKQPKAELDWHQGDVKKAGALSPVHVRAYNIISKKMYGFPIFDGSQGLLVQEEDLQW